MERARIREMRLRRGLSQERFARLLGVSLQSVRRWEAGISRPLPIISMKLEELQREAPARNYTVGGSSMSKETKKGEVDVELGVGGLFKGIGNLLDLVAKMAEEGKTEYVRSGEVGDQEGKMKGVYGVSVRIGLGGKPLIERFGNIRETEKGPVVAEAREPLVDTLDEGDRLVVVLELPGVEEKDIHLTVQGDILEVVASGRDRKYQKEVLLPSPVDPASLKSFYRNGILEIRLAKR